MYLFERTYDLDALAAHNLHIHTVFSHCAKPEMTLAPIIETAQAAGLETIALTDHFNTDISNKQFLRHIASLRSKAETVSSRVKILFGGELSAYSPGETLENEAVRQALDYRLYSCNHYHLDFWGQPDDKTPRGYAEYSLRVISSVIVNGSADCIAHPLIGRFVKVFEDKTLITKAVTDNELGALFELSNQYRTAWEINTGAVLGDPDFARRLWHIGKEVGVVFCYGTDAHLLKNIDTAQRLPEIKEILL